MPFKKVKQKNLRSKSEDQEKKVIEESLDDEANWDKLEELKLTKLLKKKGPGLNLNELTPVELKDKPSDEKAVKRSGLMSSLDLTNTFSVETNRRDEDKEMFKYIEEQLAEKKGLAKKNQDGDKKQLKNSDDIIFEVLPPHLLESGEKKSEEMLSSQMLSGIPEVDLGIEERIRNIEATEEAKVKLFDRKHNRDYKDKSTLVPTNVTANYLNSNKTPLIEGGSASAKRPKIEKKPTTVKEPVVVIGEEPRESYFPANKGDNRGKLKLPAKDKATDDYHFEKFKKQFKK